MQANQLKRKYKNKKSARVGRGGRRGKTSGRGTKGQKARAGRKLRPELRDIIKKLPKLRGRGKNSFLSIEVKPITVSLEMIEKGFGNGETVSPTSLVKKGMIDIYKGRNPQIKILGDGELTKKIIISNCLISAPARAKVEKAGGSVK